MTNLQQAMNVDDDVRAAVHELFHYHRWNDDQINRGAKICEALMIAYLAVIENVSASPMRSRALNSIVDARMLANAAITFDT